jgi:hypothetical protein
MKLRKMAVAVGCAALLALAGCGGSDEEAPPDNGGGNSAESPSEFPRDQITTELQGLMQSINTEDLTKNACKKYVDLERASGGDLDSCDLDLATDRGLNGLNRVPDSDVQLDSVGVHETSNPQIVAVMSESVTVVDEDGEVWPTNDDPLSVWFFTKESGDWKYAGTNLEGDTEAIPGD